MYPVFQNRMIQQIISLTFLFLCPAMFFFPRCAPVFLGVLVMCILLKDGWSHFSLRSLPVLFIGIFGFCLWGGISSFWSLDPRGTLLLFGRLILLTWGGLVFYRSLTTMSDDDIRKLLKFFLLGILIACALIIINHFLDSPRTLLKGKTNAQAFVTLGLTLVLSSFVVLKNPRLFIFIFFLSYTLTFVDCDTALLALWTGWGSGLLFYLWPKGIKHLMIVFTTIGILTTPFVIKAYVNEPLIEKVNNKIKIHSYIHRLYVMQATASHITNKWLLGHGLDSSRHAAFSEKKEWTMYGNHGPYTVKSAEIPTHPHNAPLQWWLELGMVGAFIAAFINFLILKSIPPSKDPYSLMAFGLYTATQTIAWINLGFWQNWWLAILLILGSLSARLINSGSEKC